MRETVSVCIICKNEARTLPRLLQSISPLADETIFIDTGSTDKSVEIAERYGAKCYLCDWVDDFSFPRNAALQRASCSWVLCLDCDDELDAQTLERIKNFVRSSSADGCYLRYESSTSYLNGVQTIVDYKLTLFRNRKEYEFRGPIHETIEDSFAQHGGNAEIPADDIIIQHRGYEDMVAMTIKLERNLKVIRAARQLDENSVFLVYSEAACLIDQSQYEPALRLLESAKASWPISHPLYSDVLYKLCICLYHLDKLDEAKTELEVGIQLFPDFTDFLFLLASVEFEQGEFMNAEKIWRTCTTMGDAPAHYLHLKGTGSFLAWQCIVKGYIGQHLYGRALRACLEGLTHCSSDMFLIRQMICLTADNLEWRIAFDILSETLDLRDDTTTALLADIAESLGRFELAYAFRTLSSDKASTSNHEEAIRRILYKLTEPQ